MSASRTPMIEGAQVRYATTDRLDAVIALLEAAQLPTADLRTTSAPWFCGAYHEGELLGAVAVELHGRSALLRSLVVVPARRGSGLGRGLVGQAEAYAMAQGVEQLSLLTTTAEQFFIALGYSHADRASAPAATRATREFSSLCPASARFMVKSLTPVAAVVQAR